MNLRDAPLRTVYVPITQAEQQPSVRAARDSDRAEPGRRHAPRSARRCVASAAKSSFATFARSISRSTRRWCASAILATLSAGFALLALVLSAIGLYGVMSYTVTRRSREIGIRMALGAARGRVLAQVLSQTFAIAVAGTIAGRRRGDDGDQDA